MKPEPPNPGLLSGRSLHRPAWPRARSPWIHWLPHCSAPAPVLHGRLGSGFGSGSRSRPAARPPPGHRPPRPAGGSAPRPRPSPPTRGRRGRSRPRARPGQSSPYPRAEEQPRKWAGDWSGLLKGPPPTRPGRGTAAALPGRAWSGGVRASLLSQASSPALISTLYLLISSSCNLATSRDRTCLCQKKKLRLGEARVSRLANGL